MRVALRRVKDMTLEYQWNLYENQSFIRSFWSGSCTCFVSEVLLYRVDDEQVVFWQRKAKKLLSEFFSHKTIEWR